jgi:ABC-type dipeptide/oligopeptide/nickel transport system permease component
MRRTLLFSALIIVLMNLIIDISDGVLDPRVRYE